MKRLLSLFLILCCSTQAAGLFDDFTSVNAQVRAKLGLAATDTVTISDTVIHQFAREALLTNNVNFQGTVKRDTLYPSYFQNTYELDSLTAEVISVFWQKQDSFKSLIYLPKNQWYEQKVELLKGKTGYELRPSFYDVEIIDSATVLLVLFPTPVIPVDSTFIVSYVSFTPDIGTTTSLSALRRGLKVAVCNYTAYLCALHLSSPKAEMLYRDFIFSIGGMKNVAPAP